MQRLGLGVVILAAGTASAQTITYAWTVTTDDGDANVDVGERAYLSLWASMEPEVVGFAGSIYDIRGIENWSTGDVLSYSNLLGRGMAGDDGWLQQDNDITGIWAFQLPPFFNPNFCDDNPIELYRIAWSTDDYSSRAVEVGDTNHLSNDVYTDTFGSSVSYEGLPGGARFTVGVPGPGAVGTFGVAGWIAARRRRRPLRPGAGGRAARPSGAD